MKLEVEAADAIFDPGVMVSCDAADRQAGQVMRAPTVIIEVRSPSTAAFDRGGKFPAYRRRPSLREYVLIDPEARQVEPYRLEMSPLAGIGQGAGFGLIACPRTLCYSLARDCPGPGVFCHGDD